MLLLLMLWSVLGSATGQEMPTIQDVHYPDLDGDGGRIAFSFQGDIWVADVSSEVCRRLTVSDGYESRPRFSPDGKWLAFVSNRYGNSDIFVMPAGGGTIRRVTYDSASDTLADWSPDGRKLLFSSSGRQSRHTCPYEVELETGRVKQLFRDVCSVSATGYSPDGRYVCGIRRGRVWWRKGYRGSANSQLMLYDIAADSMQVLTSFSGADNWPVFSADGKRFYFVSEREGRPNVFSMDIATRRVEALTRFDHDATTFLSISGDRKSLVFEWDFDTYILPIATGEPRKLALHAPIDYRETFITEETLTSGIQEMEVNRDGSLVAIRLYDDIFFVKPELKNDSIRITEWPGFDGDYFWSPDGNSLAYISQENGTSDIWVVDAETHEKSCLVRDDAFYLDMLGYTWDGKKLLFRHGYGGDGIFAADPTSGEVAQYVVEPDVESLSISPDGRWMLAQIGHHKAGTDLHIKPLEGGEWVNITQHPDGNWEGRWSPDGKCIYFISRRDGNAEVYSIDLRREPAKFEDYEEQLAEKKKAEEKKGKPKPRKPAPAATGSQDADNQDAQAAGDAPEPPAKDTPPAEKEEGWKPEYIDPFEIDFERIERRAKRLTNTSDDESGLMISSDGKTIMYRRGKEIWAMDPDGEKQRRYVTGSFSSLGAIRLQEDGKNIVFVDGGKLKQVSAKGGSAKEINWRVKVRRDQREIQQAALRQAWALLDERFYDADLHGADWGAQYARYSAHCDGAMVKDDLHHLIGRMIGELNASHLGIYGGPGPRGPSTGRLGITPDWDYPGPGIRVADVMPDGPAAQPQAQIAVGEYIMAIDGEAVSNTERVSELLTGRTGERVKLKVAKDPSGNEAREMSVKPVSAGSIRSLSYERWVRKNRQMTAKLSNGRIYYAHIKAMNTSSLERFEREVFGPAQRYDALLIDVRDNGGGNTHDPLLELLSKRVHGWRGNRGEPLRTSPYAQFDGPKALLINQSSGSDAEIFPNGFRQKGLGPIIGMTTAGAVIGTVNLTLVNGSSFRVPRVGWFTMQGADLENMGVEPDWEVPYPYETFRDGKDPQIERAVEALMEALEEGTRAQPPRARQ